MHELSIAGAILDVARHALPEGAALRSVRVTAGPLRAIEPEAMQFAWRGVTEEAGVDGVSLELDALPWTLRCPACGYEWTAPHLECACPGCGANRAFPVGGDELRVTSIEVDDLGLDGQRNPKGCAR